MADDSKQQSNQAGTQPTAPADILTEIISQGKVARDMSDTSQVSYAKSLIGTLVDEIINKNIVPTADKDKVQLIKERIAQIDALLTGYLNEIMHRQEFQDLEASWRGLHYLVMNTETGEKLKLRLLNAKKEEIKDDLKKAVEFDQSVQFKKLYEEEYGTFGGSPYSVLIGDYQFGRHPEHDFEWLSKMSGVAAAAHAPFIAAAKPGLFDMDSFAELGRPRDLSKIFESTDLIPWRSFRESEDSRYVALALPRFLLRLPYGKDTSPVEEFDFEEEYADIVDADGTRRSAYLWGNAAYALGVRITDAFAKYGWTAAIRGVEGGGLVESLPSHTYATGEGDKAQKCPTEVSITDRREKELNDLGFIALVHKKNTDQAAFFGGQTVQKPLKYNKPQATANARVSSQLPYILAASRFAHYIKCIMRDKVGSFMTRDNVEKYLNTWIANYVLLNDNASQASKAQYPLREARVDVSEIPGKPGCYTAVVYLRPHFQLEELTASIRLVAELPAPAAG